MTTVLFIIGLAAITAGAAMIFTPAGLVVGGLLLAWVTYEPGGSA